MSKWGKKSCDLNKKQQQLGSLNWRTIIFESFEISQKLGLSFDIEDIGEIMKSCLYIGNESSIYVFS